jgi:leucyl/phenylalanyl-tRNA--protein transferase
LAKVIRRFDFSITMDRAFEPVMRECAGVRSRSGEGTWVVPDMIEAYCRLHRSGYAHSVEAWQNDWLAGGVYGVSLGRCFFGESMFTRVSNASKVALAHLVAYLRAEGFELIDCQVTTGHLQRLGAREIPRELYLDQLRRGLQAPTRIGRWQFPEGALPKLLPITHSKAPDIRGKRAARFQQGTERSNS